MPTIALTVSYIGTNYHGFARQENLPTIQGALELALLQVLGQDVTLVCAGRTDAGVHARGQVVSFELDEEVVALSKLIRRLNSLLDDDIVVHEDSSCIKPDGFSARFDVDTREYRYFLAYGQKPLFLRDFVWWLPNVHTLDIEAMQCAAQALQGEHDFKSFCVARSALDKNTVREIHKIDVFPQEIMGEHVLCIQVIGNAFLHSMIRTIVGTLVEVGKGNKPASWMCDVLKARDRTAAGQTAPCHGLIFWEVRY